MKDFKFAAFLKFFSYFLAICGVLVCVPLLLGAPIGYLFAGVGSMLSALFIYALSVIVMAAQIYINKNTEDSDD